MTSFRSPRLTPEEWNELHRRFPVTRQYRDLLTQQGSHKDLSLAEQLRLDKAADFLGVVADTHFRRRSTAEIHFNWSMTTESRLQQALMTLADEMGQRQNPPWAVFAYGKLGSLELNLSSDVDLVWICQPDFHETNKCLRRFRELISDQTAFGFCHRLDFDLRAGGRLGPIVSSFEQWLDYFSNYGEAWERLAFIRFRPIWGSSEIIQQATEAATRFTYRRYLDFSLMESFKELRQKIHEQNWTRTKEGQIDLKLGLGGIRDLELFVHTMQVVYGGRSPRVRLNSTTGALEELGQIGALSSQDVDFLTAHYWRLRHLENLVQAREDQQTHILIENEWSDELPPEKLTELHRDLDRCQSLVTGFLGPVDRSLRSLPEDEVDQRAWLASLGLPAETIEKEWRPLLEQEVFSRQKDRDDRWRRVFLFQFLNRSHELGLDLIQLLPRLSEFVRKIRAKATLFHLLVHHPGLISQLAQLLSQSDYLGQILVHRPELLDSFIYQQRPEIHENLGWEEMHSIWLDQKLLSELRSGLDFLENGDLRQLMRGQSSTADSICSEVLNNLKREFHSDLQILTLGKWGAEEMGLQSDLDFIFVSSRTGSTTDYQLARRFLNRLTQAPSLFSVDLRLKPHGGSGFLVTTWDDLKDFLRNEAPAWQRQVYLRSRLLNASNFGTTSNLQVQDLFQILADRSIDDEELHELARIQKALIEQNGKRRPLKYAAGGLADIELTVQTALLHRRLRIESASSFEHFAKLIHHCSDQAQEWKNLQQIYWDLRKMDQWERLANASKNSKSQVNSTDLLRQADALLQSLDPRRTSR